MDRAILTVTAVSFSFILTVAAVKLLLPVLRRAKMGQKILDIGPSWHMSKQGTPTMGGLSFLLAVTCVSAVFALLNPDGVDLTLFFTLLYAVFNGIIGVIDDTAKFRKNQNEGLTAGSKLFLQLVAASLYIILLRTAGLITTELYIPFYGKSVDIGRLFYPFAIVFLSGFTNAVNLTDGLDGLCSSVTAVVALFFAALAFSSDNYSVSVLALALLGGCLGFLVFNFHPAKIFMGDTGSLYLGASVGALSLISGKNTVLFIVGAIYLLEAVSVMLQVGYYKMTNKRLFLMAPFHHHLEKKGFTEVKITLVFTLVTAILAALSYLFV